nr:IS5 family transposase [Ruminiclostridium cellobioparum]
MGGKNGSKRHLLVDGRGVPIALVIRGAQRHDVSQLKQVLMSIVTERPEPTADKPQHLCADKGYHGEPSLETVVLRGYIPHIVSRGEEKKNKEQNPNYKARRWVVEACHSWLNRFRKLLIRFEKTDIAYRGLLFFACAIYCF